MSEIMNKEGIPIMRVTTRALFDTPGSPSVRPTKKTIQSTPDDYFTYNGVQYVSWGSNNTYPQEALTQIGRTGVLRSALNYKARVANGLGILPCKIVGYDEKLQENLEIIQDLNLFRFLRSYPVRNYMTQAFRDLFKLGNTFPILIPSMDGKKIARIDTMNARHCRISKDKSKLMMFGDFDNGSMPSKDNAAQVITMLNELDPEQDLLLHLNKNNGIIKEPLAFPRIKNYFSNNDFYGEPDWEAARQAGWVDIANQIPTFLKNAYKNAMSIMWHISVPYAYYDKQFPSENYESIEERHQAIKQWQDSFEENLVGEENAQKTIFTNYALNESGRAEEKITIDKLDSKLNFDEKLSTSAAANGEILFSCLVNPSEIGAGTPGGPYSGNAGSGSDIREAFLVSVIILAVEKEQILDPLELALSHNGYKDIELKYKNLTLTTLDKGKNTEESIT